MLPWQQHFEGHVLLEFGFCLFCRINWLVMLGVEYFCNPEKESNCDVIDDVIYKKGEIAKFG